MTTYTYNDLKAEYKLGDWQYDSWGEAMLWLFNICDYMHFHIDADVPAAWGYVPSIAGDDMDSRFFDILSNTNSSDILHFGNVLNRYCDNLVRIGKNY